MIAGLNLNRVRSWSIAVGAEATPCERYAAEEFQRFFEQAGGARLPIVPASGPAPDRVWIGPGAVRGAGPDWDRGEPFGPEEFRLAVRPDAILIAGGRPRGTLYGVYAFLEDCLGVRFLTGDHTHVPPLGPWPVMAPADRRYEPPFAFRWPYYYETNNDPVMATRQRTNAVQTDLAALERPFMRKPPIGQDGRPFANDDPRFGGVAVQRLVGHSFYRLIPAEEFGRAHPEYFCEVDGRRRALETLDSIHALQPCLSSPDVLKIVTGRVLAQLDADPGLPFVVVGQNDNGAYCTCARCRAADEREESHMGSLLAFVNAVADAVAARHPKALVGTLAYQYSRKPPRTIRPRPNVVIQLCSIECCVIHSLTDPACPCNTAFQEDLAGWGRICSRIGVWNYLTNFHSYLSPFPNLAALQANVRNFAASGVRGLFMQAVYDTPAGELSDLRNYLIAALLWDPSRDARRWMDEFLDLHYGRAAGPIRRYIDSLHRQALDRQVHRNCFGALADYGLDADWARFGLRCFAEARAAAENEAVRRRVDQASLGVYRAALEPLFQARAPLTPELRRELDPLARRFFELCQTFGVLKIRECTVPEWRPVAAEIRQMERILGELRERTGLDLSGVP